MVYKGGRLSSENILDIKTHFKTTETFQYTYFSKRHPTAIKRGFVTIYGEAPRLVRTNSSKASFEEKMNNFKERLIEGGYPKNFVENVLSDVRYEN